METAQRLEGIIDAVLAYMPEADTALIRRAYLFSAEVHEGQKRRSGEPYLIHPVEVAYILAEMRLDEASIATGLLHDTVEDTLATSEQLEEMFGIEVRQLVDGVTKLSQIRFDNAQHRQAENFRKMLLAMSKDIRVILVKLADRLHNMRTLGFLPESKQRRVAQETMEIFAPLANRLGIGWMKTELQDLSFMYLQPEEHAALDTRIAQLTRERKNYVDQVVCELEHYLAARDVEVRVQGRRKHLYSIYRKMQAMKIEFEQVYDVIAFRVICDSVGRCYEILGHVHAMWHPIPGRFKDYIAMPKPNRYQSLHTSVIGPDGERIEIQIRTEQMHQVADYGIAAHWEYKEGGRALGKSDKDHFGWLRQLLEWQQDLSDPSEFLDTVKVDLFVDEVFVFTPRGEVISLKRGSTPVDFAFTIHSEVGTHCAGAKVNGRMVPLRYELRNGDMVEILTHPNQRPSKDWLSFVRSARARSKIRSVVQAEDRARSRELGRQMLERELKRCGVSFAKMLRDGAIQSVAEDTRHGSPEGLYIALGYGRITIQSVLERLVPPEKSEATEAAKQKTLGKLPTGLKTASTGHLTRMLQKVTGRRASSGGVLVQGMENVLIRFGKCCGPLRGDPIIGFVTRGRGITVHLATCSRALDVDAQRRIDVSWDDGADCSRPVSVLVVSVDKPGILATVSHIFSDNGANIIQANCRVNDADRAVNTFEVSIKDASHLRKVLGQIRRIKGVLSASRER